MVIFSKKRTRLDPVYSADPGYSIRHYHMFLCTVYFWSFYLHKMHCLIDLVLNSVLTAIRGQFSCQGMCCIAKLQSPNYTYIYMYFVFRGRKVFWYSLDWDIASIRFDGRWLHVYHPPLTHEHEYTDLVSADYGWAIFYIQQIKKIKTIPCTSDVIIILYFM